MQSTYMTPQRTAIFVPPFGEVSINTINEDYVIVVGALRYLDIFGVCQNPGSQWKNNNPLGFQPPLKQWVLI